MPWKRVWRIVLLWFPKVGRTRQLCGIPRLSYCSAVLPIYGERYSSWVFLHLIYGLDPTITIDETLTSIYLLRQYWLYSGPGAMRRYIQIERVASKWNGVGFGFLPVSLEACMQSPLAPVWHKLVLGYFCRNTDFSAAYSVETRLEWCKEITFIWAAGTWNLCGAIFT